MKQIIKHIFHRMKEDSLSKKITEAHREKEYHNLKTVKSCLIFWVATEGDGEWIKKISGYLPEARIDKLCFIPAEYNTIQADDITYVKNEDLGFKGKISHDKLMQLLTTPYDILIDLSNRSDVLIDYILKTSLAHCKIGRAKENFEADIILDDTRNIPEFIDSLFHVLAELKKYEKESF